MKNFHLAKKGRRKPSPLPRTSKYVGHGSANEIGVGVLGFLGNIMEKNDKGKIKENEQAAALIEAYRQRGYKL